MKTLKHIRRLAIVSTLAMVFATVAMASSDGYVNSTAKTNIKEGLYPVSIRSINGNIVYLPWNNYRASGTAVVEVGLDWYHRLPLVAGDKNVSTYVRTIEFDVEPGKTYLLGAQIDPEASEAAWADGSFWTPVITQVR